MDDALAQYAPKAGGGLTTRSLGRSVKDTEAHEEGVWVGQKGTLHGFRTILNVFFIIYKSILNATSFYFDPQRATAQVVREVRSD